MRTYLCSASIWLNRLTGGARGQTLCARIGRKFGPECRFCRIVGWVLSEPAHCRAEMIYDQSRDT